MDVCCFVGFLKQRIQIIFGILKFLVHLTLSRRESTDWCPDAKTNLRTAENTSVYLVGRRWAFVKEVDHKGLACVTLTVFVGSAHKSKPDHRRRFGRLVS